jgi:tetratricopeptide (TPR) repeat protein
MVETKQVGSLRRGIELLRKKQYVEAEDQLLQAAPNPATQEEALYRLVKIAMSQRHFDLARNRLDELLAVSPNHFEAIVTRAHLSALRENASLQDYRDTIEALFARIQAEPIPSVKAGKKLLQGIQYACTDDERVQYLEKLLESTEQAVSGRKKNIAGFRMLQADIYLALHKYGEFVDAVDKIAALASPPNALSTLQKIAGKCGCPNFPDSGAHKVFGIGLSRTATSSLNRALNILGFHSIHWLNPHTRTLIGDKDFFLFDGFTDITVSYKFESLYETFPNARFIYTSRPMESWVRSVASHYKNARGISMPSELDQPHIAQRFNGAAGPVEWNLYAQYPSWEEAYQHFHKRVEGFFADKPCERYLELQIVEGEGWRKLCTFLDKPIPGVPFPNTNPTPIHMQS